MTLHLTALTLTDNALPTTRDWHVMHQITRGRAEWEWHYYGEDT